MDNTLRMATFPRHGHLVMSFLPNIWDMFRNKEIYPLQEENILSFKGKKFSREERLIDVNKELISDDFIKFGIDSLDFVQPYFLFFKDNKFVRTIGVPDLIVEVWSINNEDIEISFKKRLYSSSPMCEHWYLTQTSNIVDCYKGTCKLPTQSIENILVTQKGITFDLRHLSLK